MLLDGRSIALIEDDPIMGESLWQALKLEGAEVSWWRNGLEAERGLLNEAPEAVICDIRLPDVSGAELFCVASSKRNLPPFLFITAFGQIDEAVHLLRAGASDYITKPFDIDSFLDRVQAILPRIQDTSEPPALGRSPVMQRIEALIRRIANLPSPVLLAGPTGSGKEVAAAFLHSISDRKKAPFVAVNCAALPAELMESELLGHERGAFTGAHTTHKGFCERAGDGILFLDEIADLPLRLQAKLLRLLEDRSFTRVGGERPIPFYARIVCASNRDLAAAASSGDFREDLYHRINTIEITLPPLADRGRDIEDLLNTFFHGFGQNLPNDLRGFASTTIDLALDHDWPGNVRELRNRVERAVALATGEWIMPWDLFPDLDAQVSATEEGFAKLADVRARAERRQIDRALSLTQGSVLEAAQLLGISRTTLWEKMKRLEIDSPQ